MNNSPENMERIRSLRRPGFGKRTADTIKALHGKDFFAIQGAKGGAAKGKDYQKDGIASKGFADNIERAKLAGSKGGKISKRGKAVPNFESVIDA